MKPLRRVSCPEGVVTSRVSTKVLYPKRLFCFHGNPQGGLANGPCLGCTHKEMRLLTSQRVNLLEVSQEQGKLGDGRLAVVNSALEIESRPYGSSSLRMAEAWVSPFLACPMA